MLLVLSDTASIKDRRQACCIAEYVGAAPAELLNTEFLMSLINLTKGCPVLLTGKDSWRRHKRSISSYRLIVQTLNSADVCGEAS